MDSDSISWCLVSHAVGPTGRVEYLLKNGENVVGRKREADINLAHLDVSREHCVIFVKEGINSAALVDRGSRNGTFVNGQQVIPERSVTLFEDDSVGFGSNTTMKETYNEKCPFLVFKITKKMPSRVFEEMARKRGRGLAKRVADSIPACIPAIKRIKADHGIASQPAPIGFSGSRRSTEVSSTSAINEDQPACPQDARENQVSSLRVRVSRSRPDGLVEFCVIDDDDDAPETNAVSSLMVNQSDQSKTHNSLLAKSTDSTIQNMHNAEINAGTPSFQSSSARTNDDTRSTQKNLSRDSSAMGNSSKKIKMDSSPARTSSVKAELFKVPLIEGKRELRSGATPPPSPAPNSPSPSNSSKTGEIPTFSLISDDEDEDELMSSQMFIKTESESQNLVMPEEPVIDEEVYEIFDSDDESMFETHLSQSFSQSFMIAEEPLDEVEKPTRKESAEKDDKAKDIVDKSKKKDKRTKEIDDEDMKKDDEKKEKKDSKRKASKDDLVSSKTSSKPYRASTSKSSVSKSSSKKTIETKKSSKKPKTASKKSESETKDVPISSRRSSEEDSLRTLRSKQVKESSKESKETPKEGSSRECKSTDSSKNAAKTSHRSEVDRIVQKVIEDSKKNISTKKAMLVEPHSLPNKEAKAKTVASTNGVVVPPNKRRVTFKENLADIKEFECLGNMKKLSTMPNHLLKEHPTKLPGLQWNAHLLRGCRLVADVCQWNIKWLNEFQMVEKDPPLVAYDPRPVGNRFKNFEDYYFTMVSLTMHELWSDLCRTHLFQTESQKFPLFSGVIDHIEPNIDDRTLFARVKTVNSPSDMENPLPNFGDLVGIEILAPDHKRTHLYSSFGVVTRQYSRERLKPSREANFLIKNLAPDAAAKAVVCPIELLFRSSKTHANNVSKDCFVRIRVYRNIMNQVKYFLALNKLNRSPLKPIIMDPTTAVNRTNETKKDMRIYEREFATTVFNELQKDAILSIANSVLTEDSSISLIHGPPGTGKSSTIASLIVHLLPLLRKERRKGPPAKILLCAPSNTAIDELCVKLLEVRRKLSEDEKFKLTRVGNHRMMHPQVFNISSHSLAHRAIMNTPDPQSLETEITLLDARIRSQKNSLIGHHLKPEIEQRVHETIEKHEIRLSFYKKLLTNIISGRPLSNPEEDRKLFHQEECNIISGAEIIATTLSSSTSKKISDALSESNQFSVCIIDEATQATEPEVIIPLNHDIRHLVLVGDPLQLGPTVTSRFAKERNFEWSLYHRLMAEWKQYKGTPLYPLREQYRMPSEIVSFPSNKFYNSELTTPSYLKVDPPFTPYQVISHSWPESATEESNEKEGRFIVDLVQKLLGLPEFKFFQTGIIVPYQNQNRFIRKVIEDKRDPVFQNVVVNTIDSFQGQERELIILSCVRTKRIGFLSDKQRLNVALTRAKKCLLVVGNFQALKADEVWGAMIDDAKSRNRFIEANPNDRVAASILFSKLFASKKVSKRTPHHRRT